MSEPLIKLEEGARVRDALDKSSLFGIHHFPIVGQNGLLAIVCTCDIEGAHPDAPVLDFAHRRVVTCSPSDSARAVARLMLEHAVGSVVVAAGNEPWGIVTRDDLMETCPELEALFDEGHCSHCDARRHLRPGPDGKYLCKSCCDRASGRDWFDLGGEA
jgi:CBS domain-containing protein